MNLKRLFVGAMLGVAVLSAIPAQAWNIKDVLGNSSVGDAVGSLVEGVFTNTNLELKDLVGEWKASGSAVTFQSDNFLKKAGGSAAAGVIEGKLDPYYEKFGLTGAVLTVNQDATFKLQIGKLALNGTIEKNEDGTFNFIFKVVNKINLGKMKTYVQKAGNNMDVMFDASKLKTLLSAIGGVANVSALKTVTSVLDSYDGLCVGFAFSKTGTVSDNGSVDKSSNSDSGAASSIGNAVKGLLNNKGKK